MPRVIYPTFIPAKISDVFRLEYRLDPWCLGQPLNYFHKYFNLCDHDISTSQTDARTIYRSNTALCVASRVKKFTGWCVRKRRPHMAHRCVAASSASCSFSNRWRWEGCREDVIATRWKLSQVGEREPQLMYNRSSQTPKTFIARHRRPTRRPPHSVRPSVQELSMGWVDPTTG